jgi:Tol biopolymer transport system component
MELRCITTFSAAVCALLLALPAKAVFPGTNGKLVFQSDRSGSWQLYTINPDGTDLTQITQLAPTGFDSFAPAFSPDGKQIAFSYGDVNANGQLVVEIFIVNADGTGLRQVTHDGGFAWLPRWSPDGTALIFSGTNSPTGMSVLEFVRTDGTNEQSMSNNDWKFWGSNVGFYTPNGRDIVFQSHFRGLVSAAFSMHSDRTERRRLTRAEIEAFPFDVSPDGTRILCQDHGDTPLPGSAFTMDLDGGNIRYLPDSTGDGIPVYSPDGRKIAFFSDRLNAPGILDLLTINADGSDLKRVIAGIATCPDGNCVVVGWGAADTK